MLFFIKLPFHKTALIIYHLFFFLISLPPAEFKLHEGRGSRWHSKYRAHDSLPRTPAEGMDGQAEPRQEKAEQERRGPKPLPAFFTAGTSALHSEGGLRRHGPPVIV